MTRLDRHSSSPRALARLGAVLFFIAGAACDHPREADPSPAPGAPSSGAGHSHPAGRETCFICTPAERDPDRLWCHEHGRYEDRCWLCHPELHDEDRLYCEEHGLYEDECFLCDPEREQSRAPEAHDHDSGGADGETSLAELYCREHRVMERECGICQPQLAASLEAGESLKVRFASPLSTAKAGVRTVQPQPSDSRPFFRAFCEIRYNANRLVRITPLAAGIVRRVAADVGARVRAGDVLVEIHSAGVATAKTEFISAVVALGLKEKSWRREEALSVKQVAAERDVQEAEAAYKLALLAVKTARQRLVNYGLSEERIAEIERTEDSSALFAIRAPYSGTIVARAAVVGEAVEPGAPLLTLADLSEKWMVLSVSSNRAGVIATGQEVEATFADLPGLVASGTIDWVDTAVDEQTRMLRARAPVPDHGAKLKAGMFGDARVLLPDTAHALRLPRSALQKLESVPYVFVKLEDDLYALRRVVLGNGTERSIDVLAGVGADEEVVVEGSFTMMSEFLKSRLGAGCVHE